MRKYILILPLLALTFSAEAQQRILSIKECKEMAYSSNTALKNSHLDYLSATMQKQEAFTNWFPVISARAAGFSAINPLVQIGASDILGTSDMANNIKYYLETEASMYGVNSEYTTLKYGYVATLNLTQPIYVGGRIVNGNRLASLGVKASEINEHMTRRDLGIQVEGKYRLVVSLLEKQKSLDKAIALSDRLLSELKGVVSSGLSNDDSYREIQLKRQELRSKAVRLKGSIMLAKMDLCNAIGLGSSEAINVVLDDSCLNCGAPQTVYRDPAEAVSGMDEVRLLDLGVEQKSLEKKIAVGGALPEIGLGASYGYGKAISNARTNGTVYVTLNVPITDWAKTSKKVKSIQYQMQKAQNNRDNLGNMLELQLRQQWVEVESRWEEITVMEESLALAQLREERAAKDFEAGLSTGSEYMRRQVESSNAECDLIDARLAYCNAVSAFLSKF